MYKILRAGRLHVEMFETRQDMGVSAARDAALAIREVIREKGSCHIIFAAAPSQNEFLEALAGSDVEWERVYAYHMDEYIGLAPDAPQGFGNFLRRNIFEKVPFAGVEYLNGGADDIDAEIRRYSQILRKHPADMVFMGIGENGHIAFNDPHVAHFDDCALVKKVELDERCRAQQVHDGCFDAIDQVPTHALTLTIPALVRAERIFCMVPAATKAEAVEHTVLGEIREMVPASILRMHEHATLYVDADSGSRLQNVAETITLRPLTTDDAPAVYAISSLQEVAQYMRFYRSQSVEDAKTIIEEYLKDGEAWAIMQGDTLRGVFALERTEEEGVYGMSTFLAPALWGRGVTTAIMKMVKEYAEVDLRAKSLQAHVVDVNVGSCTALRRNGFYEKEIEHFPDYEHGLIVFRYDFE